MGTAVVASDTTERIIRATLDLTVRDGWSAVTMARVAEAAGVSRQTVYNEVSSKPALAEAMVLHQLALFLDVVQTAFDDHPADAVAALREAARSVLDLSRTHPLLASILAGRDSAELLPLLTTQADAIHDAAAAVMAARLAAYRLAVDVPTRTRAADVIVRVVLSHLVRPTSSPKAVAHDVAWLADRLLPAGP